MKSTLLLDVVIRECTSILQLLTSKDQSLLIWRNSFLVLNLSFDVFNRVGWFNLKSDRLASQRFHEDLHTSSETKDKMKCTFLLDVVVRKGATIFKLFSREDQSLLVRRNSFLILNFGFNVFNWIRWFNFQSNGLASEGLDKNLHTTPETENEVKSALFLNVIIRECATIFQLFASKDQPLLIWRNSFLVLNFCFYILNGVRWFYLQRNRLACESLDEDLHTASKTKNKMKGAFLLDIVIRQGATVF